MHDLHAETLHAVDQYWASFLACPASTLRANRGLAVSHAGLGAYQGIYAITIGVGSPIVSVPASLLDTARRIAPTWSSESIRRPNDFMGILGDSAGQVVGPASISYCDPTTFRPPRVSSDVRTLSVDNARDVAAVEDLRRACSTLDWESGGSVLQRDDSVGIFIRNRLVALAGFEIWGERLAHISVVTRASDRRQTFGSTVVGALASRLMSHGLIPQYRTLEANTASLRVGAKLGFVPYGTSMAIRFRVADT
jgi:hypothetical protein